MKKVVFGFLLLLLLAAVGYFFLWEPNYQVSFITKHPKGLVFKHLQDWSIYGKEDGLNITDKNWEQYHSLTQEVRVNDSVFLYDWEIKPTKDSLTKVTAKIKDKNSYYKQKLAVLFGDSDFKKRSLRNVKNVGDQLVSKSENFIINAISDTLLPSTFCAYVPVKSTTKNKALDMLKEINLVMSYIKSNELDLLGDPFLEVTSWNQENDSIKFDFCFPIAKNDSLPASSQVQFKTTESRKMLKTLFNGNYRISDNAWYALLDYADRNQIEIEPLPTEIFLNDPHEGGNSLEWEAHILVPLKKQ